MPRACLFPLADFFHPLPCGAPAVIGLSGRAGHKKDGIRYFDREWLTKAEEIVKSKKGGDAY